MSRRIRRLPRALALALVLLAAPAAKAPPYAFGPPPDWSRYQALGTAAIKATLPDPDSWEVLWPNGYIQAGWKHKGPQLGYLSCATLRAVRPVQGGYPSYPVAVVIDQDRVKLIDYQPHPHNSLVNIMCPAMIAQGKLPPASMMAAAVVALPLLGISVRPVADGAYVVGSPLGTPGDKAGITIGAVITKVNGIALAGMGEAMTKVLASVPPPLLVETADGKQVAIKPAR